MKEDVGIVITNNHYNIAVNLSTVSWTPFLQKISVLYMKQNSHHVFDQKFT